MKNIVDRMLKLSALESRKGLEHIEVIHLESLIESITSQMQVLFDTKNITLHKEIDSSLRFMGEKFLLEQAFINLLQNAIDFSRSAGKIFIKAHREGTQFELIIQDEGPGIPDYALSRVFEKFYSLPRPESGKKSSGLGLSFVKEIALLHGGKIQIKNRLHQGTEAILILPLVQAKI